MHPGPIARRAARLTLAQRISVFFALVAALFAVLASIEALALRQMDESTNTAIGTLDPAQVATQQLITELDNEATAVRTYLLSGSSALLFDYNAAPGVLRSDAATLGGLLAAYPGLLADLNAVMAENAAWRANWADPSIAIRRNHLAPTPAATDALLARSDEATTIHTDALHLASDTAAISNAARATLHSDRNQLTLVSLLAAAAFALAGAGVYLGVRRWAAAPLAALDKDVRAVAGGDYRHRLSPFGPPEITGLAESVAVMRDRILDQLDTVEAARVELASQAEALARANEDLDRFADVASQDLQEPLRKVAGFSDLLTERYADRLDDRGLEFVRYLADSARRMQALIADLLSYSRVSRLHLRPRPVDLNEVLRATARKLAPELLASAADLRLEALPVVLGDPALLLMCFEHLLSNSLAYRSSRPLQIVVSAEDRGELARISVADNGQGIQPEYAERVFGVFQRLHHDDPSGTGLGLALCRRIAEVHGGSAYVDAGRIDGATVHVELPLARTSDASPEVGAGELAVSAAPEESGLLA